MIRYLGLALVFSAALPACGSGGAPSAADDPDTTHASAATGATFAGTYQGNGSGAIDAIRFDSEGYGLIPSGCEEAACQQSGTYAVSSDASSLALTDGQTGATTNMALSVLGTSAASTAEVVHIDDLVQPGTGGSLVSGTGGSVVMGSGSSLISGTVNSALVNGQNVTLVSNIPANIKMECLSNIPTGYGDPTGARIAAYRLLCPQGIHTTVS